MPGTLPGAGNTIINREDTLLFPGSQLCDHSQVLASKVVFLFVCLFVFAFLFTLQLQRTSN